MKLSGLRGRLNRSAVLSGLAERLRADRRVSVGAVVEAAYPALSAYLYSEVGGSLVYVSAHPHRAEFLVAELAPWVDVPVELFPPLESFPYERQLGDREVLARRQAVVNRLATDTVVVVTSVRALLQTVSRPQGEWPIELHKGLTVGQDALLQQLVAGGYEAAAIVDEVGTFARRGGIVDLFPIGASHPLRLEFLGDDIDSLRIFDPVTQRSMDTISAASVFPGRTIDPELAAGIASELLSLDTDGMSEEGLNRWMGDLEHLERGEPQDIFLAPYVDVRTSLLDILPPTRDHLIVLEDSSELTSVASELGEQANEVLQSLVGTGELPAGLKPGLLDFKEVLDSIGEARVLDLMRGGGESEVAERVFSRPPAYGGRIRDFLRAIDPTSGARPVNGDLLVTSYQHARLAELLAEQNVPHEIRDEVLDEPRSGIVTIIRGSLAEGWSAPSLNLEILSDHELFGWSKPRATLRRRRAARESFFTEFTPNDYVVHIEHGIGQLVGTTKMRDAGVEREYLIIQYAGSDRLYVPTDQLDRLTRYVGMGEAKPHLSKLGGNDWTRAKARAKQAAEDMAEELIALYAKREALGGHAFGEDTPWQTELESSFPFEETPDQMQAIVDVKADMEQARPMDRLVVADVGYGKTEVAVRASFKAVLEGMQVAVLVPTTILAQQHAETFRERLDAFPVRIEMLSRFRSPKEQKEVMRRLAEGDVDVVIGTHRLLGRDLKFKNLGLLVVDEEQRFGVRHKERLKQLRAAVDVLTLTATPIPRTLHMSLTGIRDVSVIQTPPEGRLPIRTYLQPYEDRLVREAIVRELERDGQVYFVHNRVAGIEAVAERIRRLVPEARVVVGHGQMPEDQLEKVMLTFAHQEADVLLSSTIIESGLDIPNVNTIILDHAEALGLAQMYQLRGRVGRGVNQAYAYLLYPRDAKIGKDAMRRMEAVFEATELGAGFRIAMTDLEIRGAGNLLGSEQSGHVAAIGFDLYTNLLKDAIDRMRGQAPAERPHVTVDLPFDVLIPTSYIEDERERLAVYRRISMLENREGVHSLGQELRDRFGPLPDAVSNLLQQVEVKLLAEEAHVGAVTLRGDLLTMRGEKRILYDRLGLYKRFGMDARIDQNILRVEASALQPDWLESIMMILRDTAALRGRQTQAVPVPVNAM